MDGILSGDVSKGAIVTVYSNITLATAIDFSNAIYQVTAAQNGYACIPGAETATNAFSSFKDSLLPASLGGSDTLYGDTKADYPFLQAQQIRGATMDETNVGDKILKAVFDLQKRSKGSKSKEALVSYKLFGDIVSVEGTNNRYKLGDMKVEFGFATISVLGPRGSVKIVAVPEMEDSLVYLIDFSSFRFAGSNFFNAKRKDGSTYFLERATTGYSYITDVRFFGDLVCTNPSHNGVIHSISY